jgi:hypothetical protein
LTGCSLSSDILQSAGAGRILGQQQIRLLPVAPASRFKQLKTQQPCPVECSIELGTPPCEDSSAFALLHCVYPRRIEEDRRAFELVEHKHEDAGCEYQKRIGTSRSVITSDILLSFDELVVM